MNGPASAYAGVASAAQAPLAVDIGMDMDMGTDKGVSSDPSGEEPSDAQSGRYVFVGETEVDAPAPLALPPMLMAMSVMGTSLAPSSACREYCKSSNMRPLAGTPCAAESAASEDEDEADETDDGAGRGAIGIKAACERVEGRLPGILLIWTETTGKAIISTTMDFNSMEVSYRWARRQGCSGAHLLLKIWPRPRGAAWCARRGSGRGCDGRPSRSRRGDLFG